MNFASSPLMTRIRRAFRPPPRLFIFCKVQAADAIAAGQLGNILVSVVTYRANDERQRPRTSSPLTLSALLLLLQGRGFVILGNYKMLRLA